MLDYTISQTKVDEAAAAAGTRVVRPIFEPGDAIFFDELFLHQTGSDPAMDRPRYAIENWFFGGLGVSGRVRPDRRLSALVASRNRRAPLVDRQRAVDAALDRQPTPGLRLIQARQLRASRAPGPARAGSRPR